LVLFCFVFDETITSVESEENEWSMTLTI